MERYPAGGITLYLRGVCEFVVLTASVCVHAVGGEELTMSIPVLQISA